MAFPDSLYLEAAYLGRRPEQPGMLAADEQQAALAAEAPELRQKAVRKETASVRVVPYVLNEQAAQAFRLVEAKAPGTVLALR